MEWNNTPPKTFARVNTLQGRSRQDSSTAMARRKRGIRFRPPRLARGEPGLRAEIASAAGQRCRASNRACSTCRTRARCWPCANSIRSRAKPSSTSAPRPAARRPTSPSSCSNEGRLVAHDIAPDRLKLIEENCARLGVTCVQTVSPSTFDRLAGRSEAADCSSLDLRPHPDRRSLLQHRRHAPAGGFALAHSSGGNRAAAHDADWNCSGRRPRC